MPGCCSISCARLEQGLHRLHVGGRLFAGQQQRQPDERRLRPQSAVQRAHQQCCRPAKGLGDVAVRRGPVAGPDVGLAGEFLGHHGMQVEARRNQHRRPDHGAHLAHQVGVAAADVLHQQCPMQDQAYPVDRADGPQSGKDLIPQRQVGGERHGATGRGGVRDQQRDGLELQLGHRRRHPREREDLLLPVHLEIRQASRRRREGERFMGNTGDRDSHGSLRAEAASVALLRARRPGSMLRRR